LRAGVPTRWIIDGDQMSGCLSVIQVPKLKIQRRLVPGQNVVEFTPPTVGDLNFSCGMGMYSGVFHVVEKI
jgi:plastocyanin domain-containing protein